MPSELVIATTMIVGLLLAEESGFRLGRRAAKSREAPGNGQVGAIQGAMLGLLGLLLGFSFAGAAGRFLERQDLIVKEANAIGTAYLRAELLDQPHRTELQAALAGYVRHRIEASAILRHTLGADVKAQVDRYHRSMWNAASEGAAMKPATMLAVLPPVNETIDLHASRVAAGCKHLPMPLMALLISCSALAMGTIGYGCGLSLRRGAVITAPLAILLAATLWMIIDLDYSRAGLIQLSDAPLMDLNLHGG